jgi:hypothetical protein
MDVATVKRGLLSGSPTASLLPTALSLAGQCNYFCSISGTAVRIRVMSARAIRITSRIVFLVCGLTSLFTGVPFLMARGELPLPFQSEWIIFVVTLGLVGLFSVTVAALPRSWIAKACKKNRDDEQLFVAPLKWLGGFAAISYLLALVAHLAPHRWNLDPQLMFSLCPLYFVKMTFDPSLVTTFFLLAPMNAAVYGSLGLTLGFARLAFRKTTSS